MPLGTVLADVLSELALAQERDELRAQEDADQQRGRTTDQDPPHQPGAPAASPTRRSATTSRPIPREPFTSTVSPSCASLASSAAAAPASATRRRPAARAAAPHASPVPAPR